MTQHVPASTAIKQRSLPHVDDDRLQRRLEYLRELLRTWNTNPTVSGNDGRITFAFRAREAALIEDELTARNIRFVPVTRRTA